MSSRAHRHPPSGATPFARWRPDAHTKAIAAPRPSDPTHVSGHHNEMHHAVGPSLEDQLAAAYESGLSDGRVAAYADIEDERARLAATVTELANLRRAVLDSADRDLIRLAVGMARRVLHREVQLDPDILLAMARVALGRLGDRAVARVHLNPDDLAAISAKSLEPYSKNDALTLVADPDVPRGGCRVASDVGEIDLGIEPQMGELARVLLGDAAALNHARLH